MRIHPFVFGFSLLLATSCSGPGGGGGDGGDALTFDEFYAAFARQGCKSQVLCGAIGASEEAACVTNATSNMGPVPPAAEIAAGRVAFDGNKGKACLEALASGGCDLLLVILDPASPCASVNVPKVAPGGTCFGNYECQNGYCTGSPSGCMGTCKAFVAEGDACDVARPACPPNTHYCNAATKKCAARAAAGAACSFDSPCLAGLVCREDPMKPGLGIGTCVARGRAGEACRAEFFGGDCGAGLFCDAAPNMLGTCKARVAGGAPCATRDACAAGFACVGLKVVPPTPGTCAAWLDEGKKCDPSLPACPRSMSCEPQKELCVAVGREGDACGPMSPSCRDRTYCDAKTMKCTTEKRFGEACEPAPQAGPGDDPCADSTCDPVAKKCSLLCI